MLGSLLGARIARGLVGIALAPFCLPDPQNVALERPYDLTPAPNYDHPDPGIDNQVGDDVDLTDGCFVQASHGSEASVTWQFWPKVGVEIALDAPGCSGDPLDCQAISEIRVHVRDQRGAAGVWCPKEARFLVSDDGGTFHSVAVWLRPPAYPAVDCGPRGPQFGGYNFWISSGPLETRGAFARVELTADEPYVFIDEVEVRRGVDPGQTNYLDAEFEERLDALGPDWRAFAEDPWSVTGPTTLPEPGASDAEAVGFVLARGEIGSQALLITNPYATPFQLSAVASDLAGPEGAILPGSALEIRHAAPAPTILFDERADALFSTSTQPPTAAARRTTHLWIDAAVPTDARAGVYAGSLTLTCSGGNCGAPKSIAVVVEVQPYALPDGGGSGATYFDWSYSVPEAEGHAAGALAEARAAVRQRYGMNAEVSYLAPLPPFQGGQPQPPDFGELGLDLDRHDFARDHLLYLAGGDNWRRNFGGHACYPSAAWDAAYTFWIGQIRAHMLARGLGHESFALYPIDEPRTGSPLGPGAGCPDPQRDGVEFYRDAAALIKAVDADLRVMIDTFESDVSVLQDLADRSLADVWVPWFDGYFGDEDLAAFYQSRLAAGETVWLYNGPVFPQGHGRPYEDGRLVPWRVFDAGLLGYGYWALFDPAQEVDGSGNVSLWRPLDGNRAPYATIYLDEAWDPDTPPGLPTGEGAVPSRRLAALRRGIEDVRALELLRALIELRADAPDCGEEVAAAAGVLSAAAPAVLADPASHALAEAWTDQADAGILALTPPEEVGLAVEKTPGVRLAWDDRGPGIVYDVVGVRLTQLLLDGGVSGAVCLAADVSATGWDDERPDPPAGDGDAYLIRAQNGCIAGSYGTSSSGGERVPLPGCP